MQVEDSTLFSHEENKNIDSLLRTPVSVRDGPTTSSFNSSRYSSRKKKLKEYENKQTVEVLQLAGEKLKSLHQDDAFDVFGKHMAYKLRTREARQNVFVQKLINDVLFEEEMESLITDFKVMDIVRNQDFYKLNIPYCTIILLYLLWKYNFYLLTVKYFLRRTLYIARQVFGTMQLSDCFDMAVVYSRSL